MSQKGFNYLPDSESDEDDLLSTMEVQYEFQMARQQEEVEGSTGNLALDEEQEPDRQPPNEPEEATDRHSIPATCLTQRQMLTQPAPPEKYLKCLLEEFGHSEFRIVQWTIIRSLLQEGRDNCAIMATGYGKSLTYQFPAVYLRKVAVVVSPLISLMQDQVTALNLTRERACFLGSAQTDKTIEKRVLNLDFNVVYSTPESITGERGLAMLRALGENLVLIAVDEAHCISQWGHDFRPAYRRLKELRQTVPHIPILALTATATLQVRDDIVQQLGLRHPQLLNSGFDRPNLEFIVRPKSAMRAGLGVWGDLGPYIKWAVHQQQGAAIVYCNTCKLSETVASELGQYVPTRYYHGSLSTALKRQYHHEFTRDEIRVIVATMAFGMGIDKPDVRLVVHYGAPKDMERYYQEVGRAGRDSLPAKCLLLYSSSDWATHQKLRSLTTHSDRRLMHLENLQLKMVAYTRLTTCRRKFILEYFGDTDASENLHERSDCCDNCSVKCRGVDYTRIYDGLDGDGKLDVSADAYKLLSLLYDLKGRFGLGKVILLLRGSKSKGVDAKYHTHPMFGKGAAKNEDWFKLLADHLQAQEYLHYISKQSPFRSYSVVDVTRKAVSWLGVADALRQPIRIEAHGEVLKFLRPKQRVKSAAADSKAAAPSNQNNNVVERLQDETSKEIMKALLSLRSKLATELDVMPYLISSNIALNQLVEKRPSSMAELRACKLDGFYDMKYERFGNELLTCLRQFVDVENAFAPQVAIKEEPLSQREIKREPLTPQEDNMISADTSPGQAAVSIKQEPCQRRSSLNDLWSGDELDDEELTQIGDQMEKQLQAGEAEKTDAAGDQATEAKQLKPSQSSSSTSELDMLLRDLEVLKQEIAGDATPQAVERNGQQVAKKRSCVVKYIDSDSEDSRDEATKQPPEPVTSGKPQCSAGPSTVSPHKVRVLPAWMTRH